jgi:hypothetical protein
MTCGKGNVKSQNVTPMALPNFCNVDLDIESKFDLTVLQAELGRNVIDLGPGPVSPGCFLLRLETVPEYQTPDDTICAFCSLLERLSPKAKQAWHSAHKKEFDVGHDVVQGQLASRFSLRTETLNRLSALGATLGITFYNPSKSEQNGPSKPLPPKRPDGAGSKYKSMASRIFFKASSRVLPCDQQLLSAGQCAT